MTAVSMERAPIQDSWVGMCSGRELRLTPQLTRAGFKPINKHICYSPGGWERAQAKGGERIQKGVQSRGRERVPKVLRAAVLNRRGQRVGRPVRSQPPTSLLMEEVIETYFFPIRRRSPSASTAVAAVYFNDRKTVAARLFCER